MIKLIVFNLYNTLIRIKKRNFFLNNLYRNSECLQSKYNLKEFQHALLTSSLNLVIKSCSKLTINYYEKNYKNLEAELNSIVVIENVLQVLEILSKDYKIGLISNLATPYKKPFYNNRLSHYFDYLVFSCDVGLQKPDKNIFKKMEEMSDFEGAEILMIGDSFKSDYLGSQNVGWRSLRIINGRKKKEKYDIESLEEIIGHPIFENEGGIYGI